MTTKRGINVCASEKYGHFNAKASSCSKDKWFGLTEKFHFCDCILTRVVRFWLF